ncbi:MAG: 16S rRNA (adenine(1518)-N(6)/adenine(1519)-N(6))-dimethyltransferase RsmA [Kineosporiaceae bacterium]
MTPRGRAAARACTRDAPLSRAPHPGRLGAAEVRRLAADLGLRPSRARGQNFVVDPATVERIARLAGAGPGEVVLEIGPGLGSLTLPLLATGAAVVAVEIDERLAGRLPATVEAHLPAARERLRVVVADAVHLDAATVAAATGPPTVLAANLPYNVAVPVLLTALERLPSLASGVVMVQAEVADRLTAAPGSRVYGAPTVKLAWHAAARRAGAVPPSVFWPVPHVDSGLVALTRRAPPGPPELREATFACVDAAFAQRRKGLRGALAPLAGSPSAAAAALAAAGLDPLTRGEQLGVADFVRLAAALTGPAPG